jgi:predicted O-methyltransferase YrrM
MNLLNNLLKLLPEKRLLFFTLPKIRQAKEDYEKLLPKKELDAIHTANCVVLPNRMALLEKLPKNGHVAELGVDTGGYSRLIIELIHPAKLHLVDAWDTKRYGEDKAQGVIIKFEKEIAEGKVQLHRGYSTQRAADFADSYFDWIYIDTNHTYQTTYEELRAYAPKMKPGGIIAGHDFVTGNWISGMRYGVREAVHEFCVEEGWEFVFLTMEIGDNPSFAIRKIR